MSASTTVSVSLETVAGLYKAAWLRQHEASFALARIRESLLRHGFTEQQVREAAGILPPSRLMSSEPVTHGVPFSP